MERVYASTITFMVNRDSAQGDRNLEYEDILLGEKLVDAYSIIAKSDGVLEGIVDKLGSSEGSLQNRTWHDDNPQF